MNPPLRAFWPVLAMLAILASSLLLTGLPILSDWGDQLIPPPEGVAEQFVTALSARRFTGALNQLSGELKQATTPEELRSIVESIEERHGGIDDTHGMNAQEQGDKATATVQVKLKDLQERELEFSLIRENHEWKLASFDPILQLTE